jgi:type VI secretion system protein VasD
MVRKLLVGLIVAAFAAGCASPPPEPPPPTVIEFTVQAAPGLNPDQAGRASPVVFRLYQLASPSAFNEADFFQLFEQDSTVLAADLVAKDEFVMAPGATETVVRELRPDARFVGLMASYRDIDNAVWRTSLAIPPNETTRRTVTLNELAITVAQAGS